MLSMLHLMIRACINVRFAHSQVTLQGPSQLHTQCCTCYQSGHLGQWLVCLLSLRMPVMIHCNRLSTY